MNRFQCCGFRLIEEVAIVGFLAALAQVRPSSLNLWLGLSIASASVPLASPGEHIFHFGQKSLQLFRLGSLYRLCISLQNVLR
jgi:hypothetical protein